MKGLHHPGVSSQLAFAAKWLAMAAAFVLFAAGATTSLNRPGVEGLYDALVATESRTFDARAGKMSEKDRARVVRAYYVEHIRPLQDPDDLARASNADLSVLLQAAHLATFYTLDDRELGDLVMDLKALEKRGRARDADYAMVIPMLVATRHFPEAESLRRARHLSSIPPIPTVATRGAIEPPTRLTVASATSLLREHFDLGAKSILVVGHPDCHFTQHAVSAISADPELRKIFSTHSQWLAPQDQTIDFGRFVEWNQRHPDYPIAIAYARSEYPMIETWATPTFYFLSGGKVVGKVVGWPEGGNRDKVMAGFDKIRKLAGGS